MTAPPKGVPPHDVRIFVAPEGDVKLAFLVHSEQSVEACPIQIDESSGHGNGVLKFVLVSDLVVVWLAVFTGVFLQLCNEGLASPSPTSRWPPASAVPRR